MGFTPRERKRWGNRRLNKLEALPGLAAWKQAGGDLASAQMRAFPFNGVVSKLAVSGIPLSPALTASRTSGPAPLAVQFDAIATVSSAVADAFRSVRYTFDFGDPGSGTFAVDGSSRNSEQGGPLAWHVFETPGTYSVTVTADDGASTAQKVVTITVEDPDAVYAGAATICVDPAGTTGWGPAGAAYTTSIPPTSSWGGKRIVLKRGSDFTSAGSFSVMGAADWQVVAGGTGAPPIVSSISIGVDRPAADFSVWPDRCVIADLACTNGYRLGGMGSHHLALRCSTGSSTYEVDMGWSTYYMFGDQYQQLPIGDWQVPKFHLNAECSFPGSKDSQAYNMFVQADSEFGFLGCQFGSVMYHNLRIAQGHKFFIAHNSFAGDSYNGSYHCLKVHGGDLTEYAEPLSAAEQLWASRYGVIQKNVFGSATCPYAWLLATCPENGTSAEGVEDILILDNTFVRSIDGQRDIVPGGRRITMEGNTVQGGALSWSTGHEAALPAEWQGPYYTSRV